MPGITSSGQEGLEGTDRLTKASRAISRPAAGPSPCARLRDRLAAVLNPRRSLRARFALLLGGSGLLFGLLAALVIDDHERVQLVDSLGQAMHREALLLGVSLNLVINDRLGQLRETAGNPVLSSGLMDQGEARLLLESARSQQPGWAWLGLLDTRGRVMVATNALRQGENLAGDMAFVHARSGAWIGHQHASPPALTAHLGLTDGAPPTLIDMGVPLVDYQGRTVGVLAAKLRWDWLNTWFGALYSHDRRLSGSDALVIDDEGRVLLGPAHWLGKRLDLPDLQALREGGAPRPLFWPGEGEFVTALGSEEQGASAATAGLTVMLRQPTALAFKAATELRERLLMVSATATLAFLLLSLWLASRVAGPVLALSEATERVSRGEPPDFEPPGRGRADEVSRLAGSLQTLHLELAHRMEQLEQTSRLAKVGGWTLELGSGAFSCTDELRRILQLPPAEAPSPRHALRALAREQRGVLLAALRTQLHDGQPCDLEFRLAAGRGLQRWVRMQARSVQRSDGSRAIEAAVQDVSRHREAEEAVRELNARLEQRVVERTAELRAANAELDAFAYAVSHDLRSPLRAMSGFAQALVEDHAAQLDPQARDYLDQITLASGRMGDLIEGLLVLSRSLRAPLRADDVDLSALARRAVAELRRVEPAREVQVDIEPDVHVQGDPRMLDAVITNLVGNAWKYSARNPAARISFGAQWMDGERWFAITDNGVGFDMAHAGRLFNAFARLHRQDEFPGLGIGLATVQRIVRRHGGRIEAQALPGEGARFRFTLPPHREGEPMEYAAT